MSLLPIWFLLAAVYCGIVFAHPGATDGDGCHLDEQSGNYHCH